MPAKGHDLSQAEMRLYHRLNRRIALAKLDVVLAHAVRHVYEVSDPDEVAIQFVHRSTRMSVSDNKAIAKNLEHEPYWAQHWPSAYQMEADFEDLIRLHHPNLCRPSILELGCGGGILSLGLALRGYRALATDISPQALMLTKLNGYANQVDIETRLLDWRHPKLNRRYDLVVATDIAYDRNVFASLEHCLRMALAEDGVAIVAEPFRSMGDDFIEYLLAHGWFLHIQEPRGVTESRKDRCRYLILRLPVA